MTTDTGTDGKVRCEWATMTPQMQAYHDTEWGFPVHDERRLFEKLSLESFQSGLSWRTILEKRENFRAAFHDFEVERIAKFTEADVNRLLQDAGIVRNRAKIEATINNARAAIAMESESSLDAFIWSFEPPGSRRATEPRSTSPESNALAKALKRHGWKFVGPTTAYAFMQAMGLVNDHHPDCCVRDQVVRSRARDRRGQVP